jgi:hypothetical protein
MIAPTPPHPPPLHPREAGPASSPMGTRESLPGAAMPAGVLFTELPKWKLVASVDPTDPVSAADSRPALELRIARSTMMGATMLTPESVASCSRYVGCENTTCRVASAYWAVRLRCTRRWGGARSEGADGRMRAHTHTTRSAHQRLAEVVEHVEGGPRRVGQVRKVQHGRVQPALLLRRHTQVVHAEGARQVGQRRDAAVPATREVGDGALPLRTVRSRHQRAEDHIGQRRGAHGERRDVT